VSLQVAILKVLSGRPGGRATVGDLNSDLAFLNSVGAEWTDRIKRLAARAPALDIFGRGLVLRHQDGWQLTAAGRELLAAIEAPAYAPPIEMETAAPPSVIDQPAPAANVVYLDGRRRLQTGFLRLVS
jgi:hypothetical protein